MLDHPAEKPNLINAVALTSQRIIFRTSGRTGRKVPYILKVNILLISSFSPENLPKERKVMQLDSVSGWLQRHRVDGEVYLVFQ